MLASQAYAATAVVGDNVAIQIFQNAVAILYGVWLSQQNPTPTPVPFTTAASYAQWVQNAYGASANPPLRTDGVLDWRTWGLAVGEMVSSSTYLNTAAFISEYGQTPNQIASSPLGQSITDPGEVGLAQAAVAAIQANPTVVSYLSIPAGVDFAGVVALVQAKLSSIEVVPNGLLDYAVLSILITLGFDVA